MIVTPAVDQPITMRIQNVVPPISIQKPKATQPYIQIQSKR